MATRAQRTARYKAAGVQEPERSMTKEQLEAWEKVNRPRTFATGQQKLRRDKSRTKRNAIADSRNNY